MPNKNIMRVSICNQLYQVLALMLIPAIMEPSLTLASESNCTQNRLDGRSIPATTSKIFPSQQVTPFYQWENNNGYCGEVSLVQAGMNNGQWMSQSNARLICGSGLSHSGPDGWCAAHKFSPNFNAQMLLETPATGVTGVHVYSNAQACLLNARLSATTYPYVTGYKSPNVGSSGYQDFLRWVKKELIAGHQVTLGVLFSGGDDAQYDHIVSVIAIGTNHAVTDENYYGDDVLYFDDHGLYTLSGNSPTDNPPIPPGAGSDTIGCTPYVFGYSFDKLAKTRKKANEKRSSAYSIIIPGSNPSYTLAGGDGYKTLKSITGHNYAFSVSGAIDNTLGKRYLVPIRLTIPSATSTNKVANPKDPIAGWQYENSMIGESIKGDSCTNNPPAYPMNPLPLRLDLSNLTPGVVYNLYEYDFSAVTGTGTSAALNVPTENFNAHAAMASKVTTFTATSTSYSMTVSKRSDQIIIFRAVPKSAP